VDFYFDVVASAEDLTSARGKGLAVAELAPLIAELGDEIERQHYVQRLSRMVQVDEITIAGRVQAAARTQHANAERQRQEKSTANAARSESALEPSIATSASQQGDASGASYATAAKLPRSRFEHEDHLLASLINDGNLLVWLSGATERLNLAPVTAEDWQNSENREIFQTLKRYLAGDEPWDIELFQDTLAPGLHGRLGHLISYAAQVPQDNPLLQREDAAKVLVRMRIERLKQETINIKYLLADMQNAGEQEAVRSFFSINNQHLRELSHLQQVMARLPLELSQRASSEKGLKIY
jgi:DNA primase